MYGIVAPGLKGVYRQYSQVANILAVFPYAKFRKFKTEQECWDFVYKFENKHKFDKVTKYGDVFPDLYVRMEYFIDESNIYYNYRTDKIGAIKVEREGAIISYGRDLIQVQLPNIYLDKNQISAHMIAIYHGIKTLGQLVDVEIVVPDHSIFYAIHSYTGKNRVIAKTQKILKERLGNYALTIK